MLEFLGLPEPHDEADLHAGLLAKLRQFLIELGRDFCFVGSQFALQEAIETSRSTCCSSTAGSTAS